MKVTKSSRKFSITKYFNTAVFKFKSSIVSIASFFIFYIFAIKNSFAEYSLNMTKGVSQISHKIYHLHMTILWICVIIGIIVFGILIYSLIMHRKSIGHQPHDFHENTAVEIIWTVIPFVILISMAIPATTVLKFIDDKSNSDVLIKVTGFQWRWQYEYPEHEISYFSNLSTSQEQIDNKDTKDALYLREVDNPLVLPINKKIRFLFTSNDVIHSWWVSDLGVKKDTVPGFINESWVKIDKPGVYRGQCAELCGARHGYMPIVVEAKTEAEYLKWLESKKQPPAPAQEVKKEAEKSPSLNNTLESPKLKTTPTKPTTQQ
ncbi:MAG: cytochrome c oxidase subunit II [Gammaproteobacteria bacterium]|nr:cytochrome c oxidase subunit II [Gammaproteobacteria bacterium]